MRLVLDPEDGAAIDWSGALPGRGAHVCVERACLEGLRKPGPLSRSFKTKVKVPAAPWPLDALEARTRKRQRELLGLAHRAGVLKSGGNLVSGLLSKGWAKYLILAADAGDRVRQDWQQRALGKGVPVFVTLLGADEFGAALGRTGSRSVAVVATGGPASVLRKALKRGAAFI